MFASTAAPTAPPSANLASPVILGLSAAAAVLVVVASEGVSVAIASLAMPSVTVTGIYWISLEANLEVLAICPRPEISEAMVQMADVAPLPIESLAPAMSQSIVKGRMMEAVSSLWILSETVAIIWR
jgi:hypothetical protein